MNWEKDYVVCFLGGVKKGLGLRPRRFGGVWGFGVRRGFGLGSKELRGWLGCVYFSEVWAGLGGENWHALIYLMVHNTF